MSFEEIFRSDDAQRDKFLARLFGIFSEEVVRCWCSDRNSRYENLGRPQLRAVRSSKKHTLDFTLRERKSGRIFIGEQKFWPEYKGYRLLRIETAKQFDEFWDDTFQAFIECAAKPDKFRVSCDAGDFQPSGAVFVTGAISESGLGKIRKEFHFHEVLSLETLMDELVSSRDPCWREAVEKRSRWSRELFSALGLPGIPLAR